MCGSTAASGPVAREPARRARGSSRSSAWQVPQSVEKLVGPGLLQTTLPGALIARGWVPVVATGGQCFSQLYPVKKARLGHMRLGAILGAPSLGLEPSPRRKQFVNVELD